MDLNAIIATGGSFILGIGAVSAVVLKFGPKVTKYVRLAAIAVDIASDWLEYIQPDASKGETKPTLTEDEVKELAVDFQKLMTIWKS